VRQPRTLVPRIATALLTTTGLVSIGHALWLKEAAVPTVSAQQVTPVTLPTFGRLIKEDPRFDALVAPDAKIEVLASGMEWAEGPIWIAKGAVAPQPAMRAAGSDSTSDGFLLFSDIPRNSIMKWKEGEGLSLFMKPSGYTGIADYGREPGSNGLTVDREGRLTLCEHGDRRIARLAWDGGKRTLADNYQGKRLNSPNDLVFKSNGDLYFTDPPYGLPKRADDPARELDFCGVYRVKPSGELTLLTRDMTLPNGLAFSPDEKMLYVAQSDPNKAVWMQFPVNADGTLGQGKVFRDVTAMTKTLPGLPDGMKVDHQGNLFATGPGGIHVMAPDGTLLGRIETGQATANLNWGNDGSVLYITADKYLCRLKTKTKGAGW
jgi:gluconolactonase